MNGAMSERDQPMLYVADLGGCAALSSTTPETVRVLFATVLERAGATIVETLTHGFPGAGMTCVLILAESHAVLHTWPETGTVHIDVFSCTTRLRSLAAIDEIARALGASTVSVRETPRASGYPASTHG
jgi:S-adenosylmethionine decarboxylase proenzyme